MVGGGQNEYYIKVLQCMPGGGGEQVWAWPIRTKIETKESKGEQIKTAGRESD